MPGSAELEQLILHFTTETGHKLQCSVFSVQVLDTEFKNRRWQELCFLKKIVMGNLKGNKKEYIKQYVI